MSHKKSFHCQLEIEEKVKCRDQCEHCALYFKPVESIQDVPDTNVGDIKMIPKEFMDWVKIDKGFTPDHQWHFKDGACATYRKLMNFYPANAIKPAAPGEIPVDVPKMSKELAAMSDVAAIEYGRLCDRFIGDRVYDSSHITEAHESGQSWMYRKMAEKLANAEYNISTLTDKALEISVERDAFREYIESMHPYADILKRYPKQ